MMMMMMMMMCCMKIVIQWWALVEVPVNFRIPYNEASFLQSERTIPSQAGLRPSSQINGPFISDNMTKQKRRVAEKLNSSILEMKLFNFGWKTGYPEAG